MFVHCTAACTIFHKLLIVYFYNNTQFLLCIDLLNSHSYRCVVYDQLYILQTFQHLLSFPTLPISLLFFIHEKFLHFY